MKFVFRPLFFLSCRPYLSNKTLKMIINRIIELFVQTTDFVQTTVVRELRPHSLCIPLGAGGGIAGEQGGVVKIFDKRKGGCYFFLLLKRKHL